MSDPLAKALGKTIDGASSVGGNSVELTLSDGSTLRFEGLLMEVRRIEPPPKRLSLRERLSGKVA